MNRQQPSLGTKAHSPGKNVWYDDDPYYIYYPADQYEDDLRNGVGSDVADLILNVKDALVKNGAWDITGAERTFYDQLDKMNDDGYSNDIDRAKGTKTSAEVKAEGQPNSSNNISAWSWKIRMCAASCSRIHVCQVCRQHAALVSNRCQGIGPALCELLDQP